MPYTDSDTILNDFNDLCNTMGKRYESEGSVRYQCLICACDHPQIHNFKRHMLTNHVKEDVVQMLDELIKPQLIYQASGSYSCMLCRNVMKKSGFSDVRLHFISKHLSKDL